MRHLRDSSTPQSNSPNVIEYAEPYWMQDVRCAQRAIEAERLASRRERAARPPESDQALPEE
jgi:hypothetical protein